MYHRVSSVGTFVSNHVTQNYGDKSYTALWGQKLHGVAGTKGVQRCGDKSYTALCGQKLHGPMGTKVSRPCNLFTRLSEISIGDLGSVRIFGEFRDKTRF